MEIIFLQEKIKLINPTADEVIEKVNGFLPKGSYLSHFIVDGIEVHEELEVYLNQHIRGIKKILIIAKTVKEHVNDLLISADEYTKRAIPELASLADEFYNNPKSETWGTLDQLLGGLQWINEMLMLIGQSEAVPSNWEKYLLISSNMQEQIRNLAEAIENADGILIGDIIQYELLPVFEELQKEILYTIDNEGTRHDLN